MAKKGDVNPAKYKDNDPSKKLLSKIAADRKYNQSLYSINLRLPAEYKGKIAAYLTGYNKGKSIDEQITLNKWLKSIIDKEIGG